MSDAREVYGPERRALDTAIMRGLQTALVVRHTHSTPNATGHTRIYHVGTETAQSDGLARGWYQIGGGVCLHWTNKSAMLREVAALLSWVGEQG